MNLSPLRNSQAGMLSSLAPDFPARLRLAGLALALSCALPGFAAETPRPHDAASEGVEDPTTMAAFT